MPERKKPTTTRKKTTPKAAAKAKATTSRTKAKSAARKVVSKPKAAANRAPKFLDWPRWQDTFAHSITCYKAIFWRYVGVLLLSIGLQGLGLALLASGLMFLVGGQRGLENLVANLTVGTYPEAGLLLLSFGALGLWFIYAVIVGIMSKVAFLAVIRDYVQRKKTGIIDLFFAEGLTLAPAYFGLACRVFIYVAWPLLLLAVLALVWGLWYAVTNTSSENLYWAQLVVIVALVLFIIGYLFYAGVRMIFAMPLLVHTRTNSGQAFAKVKALTQGAWWYVASMWLLFVAFLYALNILLGVAAEVDTVVLVDAVDPDERLGLVDLLAFLISVFIFAPITAAFQYLLMLETARVQGTKL